MSWTGQVTHRKWETGVTNQVRTRGLCIVKLSSVVSDSDSNLETFFFTIKSDTSDSTVRHSVSMTIYEIHVHPFTDTFLFLFVPSGTSPAPPPPPTSSPSPFSLSLSNSNSGLLQRTTISRTHIVSDFLHVNVKTHYT